MHIPILRDGDSLTLDSLLSTLPTIDEIERDLLQMQAEARRVMDQDVDEREAWAALRTIADGAEDG
jgi:hypothetical protein